MNTTAELTTLELKVRNHPGVMMHVVSLFSRRAFNLEGIICYPSREEGYSRIWLRVKEDGQLSQIISQLRKLVDVVEVELQDIDADVFSRVAHCFE